MSRILAIVSLAVAIAMATGACTPAATGTPPAATGTPRPASTPSGTFPSSPIDGVVVSVDSDGLNEVRSFELRTDDGRTYEFVIHELENAAEFPPGHLREHMATSSPVRVFFEIDGLILVVTRLEDAQ